MDESNDGEKLYLIKKNRRNHWCWKLKNRYSHTVVTSKLAILCLVWFGLEISLLSLLLICSSSFQQGYRRPIILDIFLSISYFVYPVFGYLGEKWTRYYIIMSGVLISFCGSLIMLVVLVLEDFDFIHGTLIIWLMGGSIIISSFGLGLFAANIVQFSINQMEHASSQQLASFARWWVFTLFLCPTVLGTLNVFLLISDQMPLRFIVLVISFFLIVVCVMFGICFKHKFVIEPPPKIDPLKLVYQVVKYAWKHKYPERRSAFTYGDDYSPSRLDFGKSRYGGPFTTDQVESVKSFRNVLAVLLSCTLFSYYLMILPAEVEVYSSYNVTDSVSPLLFTNVNFIGVLMIPLFQWIVVPFFPFLIPDMLKRIWFGLFLMVISFLATTVSYPLVSTATFSHIVSGVRVMNNVGSAFIIFSSLEFILAQAPCQMQGLLIGVWSFQFKQLSIIIGILVFRKVIFVIFCLPTGLLLSSLVVYSIVMYYYKYRLRNELSDIDVRKRVEEVYKRNFERERVSADGLAFSVSSIN